MKQLLLNPGPVCLSERVRQALLQPDLCHREDEFIALQNNIRRKLLDVYALDEKQWAAILLTGSGTSAVEAMLTSLVPEHGRVLIIENGVYGERLTHMTEVHQIKTCSLHHEWGEAIDPERLVNIISDNQDLTHVALVHHETTTGRLNHLAPLAEICKQKNLPLLLDAVSSFGAENLDFEDWGILGCAAAANKCLHGVPGTSFVICNREHLGQVKPEHARTLYLDLNTYLDSQDTNGTPFTQSVQCFYALDEALNEFEEVGGWQQRNADYWQRMETVRNGMEQMCIQALIPKEDCSCVLNAFHLPDNISYETLHDHLKRNGFIIYAGQGGLAKSIFRVSCMGEINDNDMHRFISVLNELVN